MTASGALPGIYPLVPIGGRQYADGGVHSLYSADLAAGHDVVTVLSPIPLNDYLQAKLDAEIAALGPATVHVVTADQESLAAIGPDALAAETAQAALDTGAAQPARRSARCKRHGPRVPAALPDRHAPRDAGHARAAVMHHDA